MRDPNLTQVLTDTEVNPSSVLVANSIPNNGCWEADGKFYWKAIDGSTTVTLTLYDTWRAAKTVAQWQTINDPS